MRIRPFEYHFAATLEDALTQLSRYGPEGKVLAGGTDLVLAMKHKKVLPRHVISLRKVGDLAYILEDAERLRIGALATHSQICGNDTLRRRTPALWQAVSLIGSWQIRNIATIGGNLCNASPAADSAPPLLALDARVVIADIKGEKEVPVSSFFTGPGATVLSPDQLLKEIIIEPPDPQSAGCYLKLMRKKAVDLALVGVAFQGQIDDSGKRLSGVEIGLGGVAPTPIRARGAEAILNGLEYRDALKALPDAARAAVKETSPITDIRATAEYRKAIVEVFVRRAGEKALKALFEQGGE